MTKLFLMRTGLTVIFMLFIGLVMLCAQSADFDPLTASFEEYHQYYVALITVVGTQIMKIFGLANSEKLTKILTAVGIGLAAVFFFQQNGTGSILEGLIGVLGALGSYDILKAIGQRIPKKINIQVVSKDTHPGS